MRRATVRASRRSRIRKPRLIAGAVDGKDADTEALESARHKKVLAEGREDHFEDTWGNLFDSGEEARANGIPFDDERTEPWKEGWIATDINLGIVMEREWG